MRKFNFDENDEYSREVEKFFEDVPDPQQEDTEKLILHSELQMGMLYREMNYQILRQSIRIAERYFFWRFYSIPTRMKYISAIYKQLKSLEDDEETPE